MLTTNSYLLSTNCNELLASRQEWLTSWARQLWSSPTRSGPLSASVVGRMFGAPLPPRSVPLALLLQTTHSLLGSSARLNVRGATNGLVVVVRACATRCRDCAAVTACRRRMRSGRQRDRAALLKAARGFSRPNATRTEALPCCPRCGRPADVGFGRGKGFSNCF